MSNKHTLDEANESSMQQFKLQNDCILTNGNEKINNKHDSEINQINILFNDFYLGFNEVIKLLVNYNVEILSCEKSMHQDCVSWSAFVNVKKTINVKEMMSKAIELKGVEKINIKS